LPGLCFRWLAGFAGYGQNVYVPRLEFSGSRTHLRNDAGHQRIAFWRPIEIIGVPGEAKEVVVSPLDEFPRPGANRLLSEVRGRIVGNDRRHRHRHQLRKDREGVLKRDYDGGVVVGGESRDRLALAGGEILGAFDRIKWPTTSSLRL